ncbi:MAG: protein-L-isoaspartate(D-aspartate) O-methyltransferase [Peptococcaceae bacterium]|nr:protein-L-isoaspartate(D-aspartate) O-methyltransferase [Peptococcaceae bacterium]
MVELQLVPRGISSEPVLQAMLAVPRHCFVPPRLQAHAYYDGPLAIGEGQTISQPFVVALMIEALEPAPAHRVLEVGTGSGYAAAVLSRIVSMVYTIERFESLAGEARSRFRALNYANIRVRVGDGTKGWPEEAPFDGIVVSAGAPSVPGSLCDQLKPGGCLVIPVGDRRCQELLRVRRTDGGFARENLGPVHFVPLVGEEGWDVSF